MTARKPAQYAIDRICVKNLLSFGAEGVNVYLQPLNVLIGPNGSGKSNFLDVFRILQAAPSDIMRPFAVGGASEWIWKGADNEPFIEVTSRETPGSTGTSKNSVARKAVASYEHLLRFGHDGKRMQLVQERLIAIPDGLSPISAFESKSGKARIARRLDTQTIKNSALKSDTELSAWQDIDTTRSCLSQFKDPINYPPLAIVAGLYEAISLCTETHFDRSAANHIMQPADMDSSQLKPDGSNLALFVNNLQMNSRVWSDIVCRMRDFNPRIMDIRTPVVFGKIQLYFVEEGLSASISASRVSDGTLNYLFLLALLCQPDPPPVICLDEPELGLHPDMILSVAELLKEASTRTQVIVTTHSDLLVSALSEDPTAILVCGHDGKSTSIRRLEADKLKLWLDRYSLGELWLKGEIGGTRW